ncbi:MAG: class I SAM-dependent methyltransferase [Kofleriaceae bacterium]
MRNLLVHPLLDKHAGVASDVLDLGGYDGAVTADLASRGANVMLVDLDEEGIRRARAKGINGIVAPAESVPAADRSFDVIVCCDLLPSVPVESEEKIFREIGRVLRPDGVLIMTVPDARLKLPFVDMTAAYESWLSRTGVTAERLHHLVQVGGLEIVEKHDYFGIATRLYYALAFFKNIPPRGTRLKRAVWPYIVKGEQYWCPRPQGHLIVARLARPTS